MAPILETLTSELVQLGLTTASPNESDLHAKIVDRVEKELIVQVLGACDNVQIKAAARLGINRNTLHKKLKDYGLEEDAKDSGEWGVGVGMSTRALRRFVPHSHSPLPHSVMLAAFLSLALPRAMRSLWCSKSRGCGFRSSLRAYSCTVFAAAGVLAHTIYLGKRATETIGTPLSSEFDWYLIAAWALAAVYPRVDGPQQLDLNQRPHGRRHFHPALGCRLVAPAGYYFGGRQPLAREVASNFWVRTHLTCLALGFVSVLVGFVVGVMDLVQASRLKRKIPPQQGLKLPSWNGSSTRESAACNASFVLLTLGLLTDVILNMVNGHLPGAIRRCYASPWSSLGKPPRRHFSRSTSRPDKPQNGLYHDRHGRRGAALTGARALAAECAWSTEERAGAGSSELGARKTFRFNSSQLSALGSKLRLPREAAHEASDGRL